MNFSNPMQTDANAHRTTGAGFFPSSGFSRARFLCLISAFCFLLSAFTASAANVRTYFINTFTGDRDTNYVVATKISSNILSSGGVIAQGIPTRLVMTNGASTNFFASGFYSLVNSSLGKGVVINVSDNGAQLYDYTNLLYSGFNTYATVYGSNLPPTYDNVTNALGFLPLTPTQTTNAILQASNSITANLTNAINGTSNSITANLTNYVSGIAATLQAEIDAIDTGGGTNGGSATNVFFLDSSTINWSTTGGSNVAKLNVQVTNDYIARIIAASNSIVAWPGGPEVWINPPQIGPTKGTDGYAVTALNSRFVFLPDSGIARTVFIHADFGDQNNFLTNAQNINFQMFHNVGSTTNPPASSNLCINIPMSELMMNQHRFTSNNPYSLRIDSEFLHVVDQSTNSNYGGYIKEVVLLFPMAWTNGAVFRLTNTLYGSNYAGGYISIRYDVGTPVGPYAHWRLQNKRYSGSISATVSNHLFSVNSSAVIVGFQNSLLGTFGGNQIVNFQDSHAIRIQTQGTTAYEGSGGDDLYLNTYGGAPGLHENRLVGTVNIVRDSSISTPEQLIPLAMEQYRWFTRDAINCTSNFVANINGAFSDLSSFKFNCWYYAPMP